MHGRAQDCSQLSKITLGIEAGGGADARHGRTVQDDKLIQQIPVVKGDPEIQLLQFVNILLMISPHLSPELLLRMRQIEVDGLAVMHKLTKSAQIFLVEL